MSRYDLAGAPGGSTQRALPSTDVCGVMASAAGQLRHAREQTLQVFLHASENDPSVYELTVGAGSRAGDGGCRFEGWRRTFRMASCSPLLSRRESMESTCTPAGGSRADTSAQTCTLALDGRMHDGRRRERQQETCSTRQMSVEKDLKCETTLPCRSSINHCESSTGSRCRRRHYLTR